MWRSPRNLCPAFKPDEASTASFRLVAGSPVHVYFIFTSGSVFCSIILMYVPALFCFDCIACVCFQASYYPADIWNPSLILSTCCAPCHETSPVLGFFCQDLSWLPSLWFQLSLSNRQDHSCPSHDKLNRTTACCICFHQVWELWPL